MARRICGRSTRRHRENDICWVQQIFGREKCCGQGCVPSSCIRVVYKVTKIEDDLSGLFEHGQIATHILDIAPHNTILCWFSCGSTEDLDIIKKHQSESIELASLGCDREIEHYAIVLAVRW